MHIPRIYIPQSLSEHTSIELDKAAMHHLVTVMRMKVGRQVILFNGLPIDGRYGEFTATLASVDKKHARIDIGTFTSPQIESPLKVHLGACLIKTDRMDWLLQKATELGVNEITLLFSEYTDVKLPSERIEKKMEHWRKVTVSACEQSGRVRLPVLHSPLALDEWVVSSRHIRQKFVLHPYAPHTSTDLHKGSAFSPQASAVALLVGPEGGLTEGEVDLAVKSEFKGMRLGPRILRAETAPLVALSLLSYQLGDF
jgi:16S rRNA (uracil1498-N3)-methyltransferase